jgi:hypothetical protein
LAQEAQMTVEDLGKPMKVQPDPNLPPTIIIPTSIDEHAAVHGHYPVLDGVQGTDAVGLAGDEAKQAQKHMSMRGGSHRSNEFASVGVVRGSRSSSGQKRSAGVEDLDSSSEDDSGDETVFYQSPD